MTERAGQGRGFGVEAGRSRQGPGMAETILVHGQRIYHARCKRMERWDEEQGPEENMGGAVQRLRRGQQRQNCDSGNEGKLMGKAEQSKTELAKQCNGRWARQCTCRGSDTTADRNGLPRRHTVSKSMDQCLEAAVRDRGGNSDKHQQRRRRYRNGVFLGDQKT